MADAGRPASDLRQWLAMSIAVVAALWFNAWVLDPAHFFFADDWGWLARVHFHEWTETVHLLKTPSNASHLAKSIRQLRSGKARPRSLVDA